MGVYEGDRHVHERKSKMRSITNLEYIKPPQRKSTKDPIMIPMGYFLYKMHGR